MADPAATLRRRPDACRLDKWLWAARLFKTRSTANQAIARHRVKLGGQRVKPSRLVKTGDALSVEKGPYTFELTVLAIDDVRRGAPEASLLYTESEASLLAREAIRTRRRFDREARLGIAGSGRPSKRQRRDILRLQELAAGSEASERTAGPAGGANDRDADR